jgi:hypothetical protein
VYVLSRMADQAPTLTKTGQPQTDLWRGKPRYVAALAAVVRLLYTKQYMTRKHDDGARNTETPFKKIHPRLRGV